MRKFKSALWVMGVILVIVSCTYKQGAVPSIVPASALPDSCSQGITYSKTIAPLMVTYCGTGLGPVSKHTPACHQSMATQSTSISSPYDFSTYTKITQLPGWVSLMQQRINAPITDQANFMPYYLTIGPPTMTSCDLAKLNAWLQAGGPNN